MMICDYCGERIWLKRNMLNVKKYDFSGRREIFTPHFEQKYKPAIIHNSCELHFNRYQEQLLNSVEFAIQENIKQKLAPLKHAREIWEAGERMRLRIQEQDWEDARLKAIIKQAIKEAFEEMGK